MGSDLRRRDGEILATPTSNPVSGPASGIYILEVRIANFLPGLAIGRLGQFDFEAGCYLYVGSALNSLCPRLRRHFTRPNRQHWHIDYLLAAAKPVGAWTALTKRRLECELAAAIASQPGVEVYPRRFGSSDCRCGGHLLRLAAPPDAEALRAAARRLKLDLLYAPAFTI